MVFLKSGFFVQSLFRATDVRTLLTNFGKATRQTDPIIHFYETFLAEYDPKLRKSRGVWYTPEPVVDFIVRAVDDILKTDFNLPLGLADNSKTSIQLEVPVIKGKGKNRATPDGKSRQGDTQSPDTRSCHRDRYFFSLHHQAYTPEIQRPTRTLEPVCRRSPDTQD